MKANRKEREADYWLSRAQIKDFFKTGFVLLPDVFSKSEVAGVRQAFDRLQKLAERATTTTEINGSVFFVEGNRIDRIVWCGAAEESLLELSCDPRLTVPAAQLLGSHVMEQLICQAHYKLPEDGVAFNWHQDSIHRRYGTELWTDVNGKGSYVQTFLAIDEMTKSNGPLMLVPKSSQRGHLDHEDTETFEEITSPERVFTLTMKPGSVLLMHPYTVHGSVANASNKPRRILINGYAYPGANRRVYPGKGAGRKIIAPALSPPTHARK